MAMKRKLKWTAVVLAVALLGFGTALWLWPRDRITVESWKQIEIGMTEKQVEEILRGPGNDGTDEQEMDQLREMVQVTDKDSLQEPNNFGFWRKGGKFWLGNRGLILINFERGMVAYKEFQWIRARNFIDRLRDWLGW
jgi:hypothetical protein